MIFLKKILLKNLFLFLNVSIHKNKITDNIGISNHNSVSINDINKYQSFYLNLKSLKIIKTPENKIKKSILQNAKKYDFLTCLN